MVERISSEKIPAAVGSYSAASKVGNLIFTSGQLPINVETGKIDQPESIEWQVAQSLRNVQAILEDNGSSMKKYYQDNSLFRQYRGFCKFQCCLSNFL